MKWYLWNDGDEIGDYEANCLPSSYEGHCVCPLCGQETVTWFGELSQDWDGSPIYGECELCHTCEIRTSFSMVD